MPALERVPTSAVVVYNFDALPAAERFVADADLFGERVVGGLGPQLPYDPMRGVDYGFVQALNKLNADPFAEHIVGGLGPQLGNDPYGERIVGGLGPQSDLDPMMTVMTDWVQPASDVDSVSEKVLGGLGPQLQNDPMRGVDYGFVQALLQQNADPFAEHIVGGLGPQPFNAVTYSEVFADGQLHIIPTTDVETFILAGN